LGSVRNLAAILPASAPFIQRSDTTLVFPHCFPCPSTGTCVPPWEYCPSETSHA
jgi:hypothetical protein